MNAPAQPVPPVSNPATFFASRVLPDQIAEALIEAREKCGVQKRKDEDGHSYFDAIDVVPEVGKVFRDVGLSLFAPNFQIRSVGTWLVLQRAGCLRHDKGSQFPITAEWLIDLGGLPPGPAMNAALTQSTSGLYRVCMDLVKDETKAKRDPALTASDAERSDNSTQRSHKPAGKKHTAKQTSAWAEVNGIKPAADVSEKEQREAAEELARVEAEKRADADPRFKDEKPLSDPPGLMEDEEDLVGDLTAPPAPAEKFDQPASGNSDTSSGGGCKTAPESTPQVTESASGATHSESSAGVAVAPPSEPPAPGPSDVARCGNPQCGYEFSDSLRCPECDALQAISESEAEAAYEAAEAVPLSPERIKDIVDYATGGLTQPTPEQVALVASKASGVLVKRSAEGRAGKWAGAKTREARKEFWCAECQPENGPRLNKDGQRLPAIRPKDQHKDSGNGPRCCWACWERLESEAAGAGKEVA